MNKKEGKIFLQSYYVVQNNRSELQEIRIVEDYNGDIKFKIDASIDSYRLYYSTDEKEYKLLTSLEGNLVKSNGYTGAHLGLFASGNGNDNNDLASFEYVNYFAKMK